MVPLKESDFYLLSSTNIKELVVIAKIYEDLDISESIYGTVVSLCDSLGGKADSSLSLPKL